MDVVGCFLAALWWSNLLLSGNEKAEGSAPTSLEGLRWPAVPVVLVAAVVASAVPPV